MPKISQPKTASNTLTILTFLARNFHSMGEQRTAEAIRRAIAALEFYGLSENYLPNGAVVHKKHPDLNLTCFNQDAPDFGSIAREVLNGYAR
jgi:hypothetical protein